MKEENKGKVEKVLQDLGKSIDELISKAKNSKGSFKKELEVRIEELKRNKKTLETEFEKFRKEHASDMDQFEKSAQQAAAEVKKSIDNLVSKFKKNN